MLAPPSPPYILTIFGIQAVRIVHGKQTKISDNHVWYQSSLYSPLSIPEVTLGLQLSGWICLHLIERNPRRNNDVLSLHYA